MDKLLEVLLACTPRQIELHLPVYWESAFELREPGTVPPATEVRDDAVHAFVDNLNDMRKTDAVDALTDALASAMAALRKSPDASA